MPVFSVFCLLVFFSASAVAEDSDGRAIEVGTSETLHFSSISQAAVSDGKVLRIRQTDERSLLLTARNVGQATVRVWDAGGKEHAFQIRVVATGRLTEAADLGVVRVRLQVLEVSERARRQVGIHWPQTLDFRAAANLDFATGQLESGARGSTGQGWIRQLMENGFAKLLSQPDLLVVLGEQASFSSGGEVPYPVLTDSYGRMQQSIHWKTYGLALKIRPESVDGFVIRSDVQVEVSELASHSGMDGIPSVSRRSLSTKVNSREGDTVFLSGLIRQSNARTRGEVPFIADVPVVGLLFQERGSSDESSEVVIAMTLNLASRAGRANERDRMKALELRSEKLGETEAEAPSKASSHSPGNVRSGDGRP